MKVIEMERRTMDGKPVEYNPVYENGEDFRDWWCVIETKEEELLYDKAWNTNECKHIPIWNELVNHAGQGLGVCHGDDDIYGYIRPDEEVPEVGEEFIDSDGDTWVRVY